MTETEKKIVLAAAFGGSLGALVAIFVLPLAGALLGLVAGFLAYEFPEVIRAVPKAAAKVYRESGPFIADVSSETMKGLGQMSTASFAWLIKKRPAVHTWAALWIGLTVWYMNTAEHDLVFVISDWIALVITLTLFILASSFVYWVLISIGSYFGDKAFYVGEMSADVYEGWRKAGLHEIPYSYLNGLRWAFLGICTLYLLAFWWLPKWTAIFVWKAIPAVAMLVWTVLGMVFSNKRLVAGIAALIGATASFIWYRSSEMTLLEQVTAVVAGGMTSAVVAILLWRVISVRVLKYSTT